MRWKRTPTVERLIIGHRILAGPARDGSTMNHFCLLAALFVVSDVEHCCRCSGCCTSLLVAILVVVPGEALHIHCKLDMEA